jgi:hypothetical protein
MKINKDADLAEKMADLLQRITTLEEVVEEMLIRTKDKNQEFEELKKETLEDKKELLSQISQRDEMTKEMFDKIKNMMTECLPKNTDVKRDDFKFDELEIRYLAKLVANELKKREKKK